ncbi:MAG: FkbM family methyltransferase [Pyrinomonadaceae bacterium]
MGLIGLVKLYNDNFPVRKGKLALAAVALRYGKKLPPERIVETFDGRRLYANLAERGMYDSVYFVGEFEPAVTKTISSVVRPGDVCLDIGANFGWYTTLLHRLVGAEGTVHSFEPVPGIFASLKRNLALAGDPANVRLNNVALGDAPGEVELHLFEGLPNGHTSLSTQGRDDFTIIKSPMLVLNNYLADQEFGPVNFVKMDVEGAELMCLRGAGRLFDQEVPPIWMIEMAEATARGFDYLPDELIKYMRSRADYEFYAVDERSCAVFPVDGFAPNEIGANVLCVPAGKYRDRLEKVSRTPAIPIARVPGSDLAK